jgi:hypothetical protein
MSFKSLLDKFPNSSTDWNSLLSWLKSVEAFLKKDPSCFESEKYLLATRLTQCFNPDAVGQIHMSTLSIYSVIFHSPSMIPNFSLFSSGLFHYFDLSSNEIKSEILSIIQSSLVPQSSSLTFAFPGIVSSLLPGLMQGEISTQICQIFDEISEKDRQSLFGAVWQSVLRSSKLRPAGLNYLLSRLPSNSSELRSFLPQKNLLINSLVASMNSEADDVQNMTLTLLIRHFPIYSPAEVLEDKEKITLMQQGFKMLDRNNREKAFEWLFPYGPVDHWILLKQQAVRNLFEGEVKKGEEITLPLDVVIFVLEKTSPETDFFKPITVPMLKYSLKNNESSAYKKLEERINKILEIQSIKEEVWKSLKSALDEDLRLDRTSSVEVIQFFIAGFDAGYDQSSMVLILESLLLGIQQLHDSLTKVLELVQMIMNRIKSRVPQLSAAIKNYHNFFSAISNDPARSSHLKTVASLLLSLEKHGDGDNEDDWVRCLFEAMLNNDKDLALIGIENIVDLLSQEKKEYYQELLDSYCENSNILSELFNKLWNFIEELQNRKKVVELFLKLERFDHDSFIEKLKSKLIGSSDYFRSLDIRKSRNSLDINHETLVKDVKKGLKIFTEFWKFTCKCNPEEIGRIFRFGDGIFLVIDNLENSSPEVRQLAREWIFESLEKFEFVLGPILNILMQIRVRPKGDFYEVEGSYESGMILDSFKKLKKLIRNGSETIITKTKSLRLGSKDVEEFLSSFRCLKAGNYLEALIEIALLYIRTECSDPRFQKENHTVRAAAAEFLDLALTLGEISLAHRILNRVLQVLSLSIQQKDGVLQLLLLNVLRVVFFEFNPSPSDETLKSIICSSLFSSVYLEVLKIEDSYIFSHWINFIVESLPRVMQFLPLSTQSEYYKKLVNNFCQGIPKTPDKTPLLLGLKAVLHRALEIGEEKSDPVPQKGGILSYLRGSGSSAPQIDVKSEILLKLPEVLQTFLSCVGNFNLPVEVSKSGTGLFKSGNLNRGTLPVLEILNPIMLKYPNETISSIFQLWKGKANDEEAKKIVFLMVSLSFELKILIIGLGQCIEKVKQDKKLALDIPAEIVAACHFLYSVVACVAEESIPKKTDETSNFWQQALQFFLKIDVGLNCCWLLDILHLFICRVKIDDFLKDASLKKNLQMLTENLVKTANLLTFQQNQNGLNPPFPPSVHFYVPKERLTSSLSSLLLLKSTLFRITNSLFQSDSKEKGQSLIQSPVMEALNLFTSNNPNFDVDQTAELMSSLICLPETRPSEKFKKQSIDYSVEQSFFRNMRNSRCCLSHWKKIINCLSSSHYPDKTVLVKELLNRELGIFSNENIKKLHRTCKLKSLAFFIYSSEKDSYSNCLDIIIKSLTELLKSDRSLNPWVFFTVRVLLLKSSHNSLSSYWPQLWPHLLTELMQMLGSNEGLSQKFAALKFLDLFSAVNSEEFLIYQWLFFYDSLNSEVFNENSQFPLVNRLVGEEVSFEDIEKTTAMVNRPLVMKNSPATEEEFGKLAKELCRQVVRSNTLRSTVKEEDVESVIEDDFFMLNFSNS